MDFSAYEKGNPFMSYNHIQICKVDPDCCVVKVNLVAESMNLHGHVHGGLLYAMADCVAGIFARMDGRDYVTQSAHINFLHNVQSGTIFAKAEIIKRGKHMAYFHISITDQDDHLLCDGISIVLIFPILITHEKTPCKKGIYFIHRNRKKKAHPNRHAQQSTASCA